MKPSLVKTVVTGQDVRSQLTIIVGSSYQINQQITKRTLQALCTNLRRNQFAQGTFASPVLRFAICLVDSKIIEVKGCSKRNRRLFFSHFHRVKTLSVFTHLLPFSLKGRCSRAVIRLCEIINSVKWALAWLSFTAAGLGWYEISHIYWKSGKK